MTRLRPIAFRYERILTFLLRRNGAQALKERDKSKAAG
jgi:hypothetical protein